MLDHDLRKSATSLPFATLAQAREAFVQNMAVCLLPGTELSFTEEVRRAVQILENRVVQMTAMSKHGS
jgi:hypothetical protein